MAVGPGISSMMLNGGDCCRAPLLVGSGTPEIEMGGPSDDGRVD